MLVPESKSVRLVRSYFSIEVLKLVITLVDSVVIVVVVL